MKSIRFLVDVDINGKYHISKGLSWKITEELENGYVFEPTEDRIVAPKSEESITFEVVEND